MNIPIGLGTLKRPPQTRGRGQVIEGKYQPTHRGARPWEENFVSLAGLEGYEEDWNRLGSILLGPQEPVVQMKIGVHPIVLTVDTGVEHSVVTQPVGPFSSKHTTIIRATGDQACCSFLMAR
jgi:hypothetical protein